MKGQFQIPPKGGRKHPYQEFIKINTKNILFILGGAFVGLDKIVSKRLQKKAYGYKQAEETKQVDKFQILSETLPVDLIRYGMIPEFIGRVPVLTALSELKKEDLVEIMDKPKNAIIKQYSKIVALEGAKFIVTQEAKEAMAQLAIDKGVGARGIRSIMEHIMMDIMYELPSMKNVKEVVIDKDIVEGKKDKLLAIVKNKTA